VGSSEYGGPAKIWAMTKERPTSQSTGKASVIMAQITAGLTSVRNGVINSFRSESLLKTPWTGFILEMSD
jgi:hypothetical protein